MQKNGLDFIKYEIKDDLETLFVPVILNFKDTIDHIIKRNLSVSRFGDGEFTLMQGGKICFQDQDKKLTKRLKEILTSPQNPGFLIGLPYSMCHSTSGKDEYTKSYDRMFWGKNTDYILSLIDKNKVYADTGFTILPDSKEKYDYIKQIWKDKDITIICGERVFKNINHNVFECAKSIDYIYAPTVNAFSVYDDILAKAKTIDKNRLVIIILGPSTTVLAYDLSNAGYQALDMGHIAKSYDTFCKNHEITPEFLKKFFDKD